MIPSQSLRLHFQCSFDMRPTASLDEPWTELAKSIRHWITQAPRNCPPTTNDAFYSAWFFVGGDWRGTGGSYPYVKTARIVGAGTDHEPEHWALRYEHNCEVPGRVWRIDIGITRRDDRLYRFSIVTSQYLREGFIGREPPSPIPSAPNIVAWLLQSKEWEAFAGSERLYARPRMLCVGEGEMLRERLENPRRECPIIVISRDFTSRQSLINAEKLAKLLSGSAIVFESESNQLDKELEWCLGRRFSCWNGMVRVYQPGLHFDDAVSPKRQRYLSGREILQHGHDAVIEMLVQGVVRRTHRRPSGVVSSLEDLQVIEREHRLAQLKAAMTDRSSEEWIQLLEQTNAELEQKDKSNEATIQDLKDNHADYEDQIARLEFEKKAIISKNADREKEMRRMLQQTSALSGLSQLPESVSDVIVLIEQLHGDRITFTERAKKAASDCRFGRIDDAWRCFWAMATTLHKMLLTDSGRPGNIEKAFFDSSGFYLVAVAWAFICRASLQKKPEKSGESFTS